MQKHIQGEVCDIINSHNKNVNIVHRQSFIIKIWHFIAPAVHFFLSYWQSIQHP